MKNKAPVKFGGTLHFSQLRDVTAKELGQPEDSGNGYYSYTYHELPFTFPGEFTNEARATVSNILHEKHYRYPFVSCGPIFKIEYNADKTGGKLYYSTVYHHGD